MKRISIFLFLFCFISLDVVGQYSFVDITKEAQALHIKSTLNKKECNNKTYLPIEIPKNSKGLIYSIRAVDKSDFKSPKSTLLNEVKKLSKKHDSSKIADYIIAQGTARNFNLYLIEGNKHIQSFNNCGHYEYIEKYIGTKSRAGYIDTEKIDDTFYLGIENNQDLKNLRVIIEVIAVVKG